MLSLGWLSESMPIGDSGAMPITDTAAPLPEFPATEVPAWRGGWAKSLDKPSTLGYS